MASAPEEMSSFLTPDKKALSPQALSILRVMAFLDSRSIHNSLLKELRLLFAAKNEELKFDFPITADAQKAACIELTKASLLHFSKKDNAYSMRPETKTSVLADTQKAGLISPLFNATVKIMTGLWPRMVCIPDPTVSQEEYHLATAPNVNYEMYLKKRYLENRLAPFQDYTRYAHHNIWGRRDELVHHVTNMEQIFYHFDDDMIEVCATVTFAMLLTEAAWCVMFQNL